MLKLFLYLSFFLLVNVDPIHLSDQSIIAVGFIYVIIKFGTNTQALNIKQERSDVAVQANIEIFYIKLAFQLCYKLSIRHI